MNQTASNSVLTTPSLEFSASRQFNSWLQEQTCYKATLEKIFFQGITAMILDSVEMAMTD